MTMSDNLRGSLFMMGAMLVFVMNDALMKSLSDELPLLQAIALRGIGTSLALAVLILAQGGIRLDYGVRNWTKIGVRTAAEAIGSLLYIAALFHLPLANTTAILQALPLAVTLAGALFLREPIGWRRLAAIAVGLFGVMLIVRPGPDGFNVYTLLALGTVVAVTLREIVTRSIGRSVPSLAVAICTGLGGATLGLAGSLLGGGEWVAVPTFVWIKIFGTVACLVVAYIWSIQAMRFGELAVVSPFRYTGLLFGLLLGFLVFGEWPDPLTLVGAAIVAGTGIFTLFRERGLSRPRGPVPLRIR